MIKVLLADESVSIKKAFLLLFENYQAELKVITVGVDVVEYSDQYKPDIIFVDTLLPKLNGYEVCSQLKNDPKLSATPVVVMWSNFMELDEDKFVSCRANSKIEKPFETEVLLSIFKNHLTEQKFSVFEGRDSVQDLESVGDDFTVSGSPDEDFLKEEFIVTPPPLPGTEEDLLLSDEVKDSSDDFTDLSLLSDSDVTGASLDIVNQVTDTFGDDGGGVSHDFGESVETDLENLDSIITESIHVAPLVDSSSFEEKEIDNALDIENEGLHEDDDPMSIIEYRSEGLGSAPGTEDTVGNEVDPSFASAIELEPLQEDGSDLLIEEDIPKSAGEVGAGAFDFGAESIVSKIKDKSQAEVEAKVKTKFSPGKPEAQNIGLLQSQSGEPKKSQVENIPMDVITESLLLDPEFKKELMSRVSMHIETKVSEILKEVVPKIARDVITKKVQEIAKTSEAQL